MNTTEQQQISGRIERVISKNAETGWAVIEVLANGKPATLIGGLSHVDEGLQIEADGAWTKHDTFGWQFKATAARVFAPVGAPGIERFLRSGAVEGIGPVFAKKIVEKFGDDTLTVIEKHQWRLKNLKGVGPKRIKAVVKGVKEYRNRMEVMSFLHGKLGPVRAQRVYEKYGDQARETISKNPYQLIDDFERIGFAIADEVARDVGVDLDHEMRLRASVLTALKEAAKQGHTCVSVSDCEKRVERLLGNNDRARRAIELADDSSVWSTVSRNGVAHFELNRYRFLEERIVSRLQLLLSADSRVPQIDPDKAIPWAEQQIGISLEKGQSEAVATALRSKVAIITGGPGTGKTTILNVLLRILKAKKLRVALAAPTGRASRRMAESTGHEAETIHRLLEFSPKIGGFLRNQGNPLDADAVIIDEGSMIDLSLARSLIEAIDDGAKLLIVGDKDQLPSVGPGQVLADMIASGVVPVARLTRPFRQVEGSSIIANAHLVNAGMMPELDANSSEFEFIETKNAEQTAENVIEQMCHRLPGDGYDPMKDVMCLLPMHRGPAGIENINQELQKRLNGSPATSVTRGAKAFGVGDKVIQLTNNRDLMVFNGDIGVIRRIDHGEKVARIQFDQQMVLYPFSDMGSLALAYGVSVHKSQGSEYPATVVAIDVSNMVLLSRKLLYTALTRAKSKVVLVGQRRALHIAVSEARAHLRVTKLRDRLGEGME